LAPPPLAGTLVSHVDEMLRRAHPDWSDAGVAATLANLDVLPDGTVRPWLTPDRHVRILRGLWEQRPSSLLADLAVPLMLVLADSGDQWMPAKRKAADRATRTARRVRAEWFSPGDHDLHVQHPDAVAELLHGAATDGFFSS
jgi:pimeloyl-ACP methyl ester carboxylesterase